MDYQKFIEQLPKLYENWGQESIHPSNPQFQEVINTVKSMTTANIMQLLNWAVKCMEDDEIYCEIGSYQGSTLIGALLNNSEKNAYAVDNFSEFYPGENLEKLSNNLARFSLEEQVIFCNQDFEEFFFDLKAYQPETKIGVYLYDGAYDYRSQLLGLLLVKPFLAEKALIIVNDSNQGMVKQANWDFLTTNPQCQLLLDLSTPKNNHHTFWNGIQVLRWDISQETSYDDWVSFTQKYRNQEVIEVIYSVRNLPQKATINESKKADEFYQEAIVDFQREQYQDALDKLQECLKLDQNIAKYHYTLGLILEKVGETSQAIEAYQKAINLNPQLIDAYNNLGNIYYNSGEIEQAEEIYRQGISANPNHFGSYINLGNLLLVKCQINEAINSYQTANKLNPDDRNILQNIELAVEYQNQPAKAKIDSGDYFYARGKYEAAIENYRSYLAIKQQFESEELYLKLGKCYEKLLQYQNAAEIYQAGVKLYPTYNLYLKLILALNLAGNTQKAIEFATEAVGLFPSDMYLIFQKYLTLPYIYENAAEIDFYRQRFTAGLEKLSQTINLETPEAQKNALKAIGEHTNFSLAYQAKNDLKLQQKYGLIVQRIMAANYPQWREQKLSFSPQQNGKIRLGYISFCMREHTIGKLMLGWLHYHDKTRFEIYSYYLSSQTDNLTELFKQNSFKFYQSTDIEAVGEEIIADKIHILVWLDMGMQAKMIQLGSLRFAPVQCKVWGPPVTSGLSTIDYFISCELMEPENAQTHYSEKLITLPNIGLSYPKPQIPSLLKNRAVFQLRDDAVVYLCSQTITKYLPQHDYILASIAQQVPKAQFVFIARPNDDIAAKFYQRLQVTFAEFGLNIDDHCVILPQIQESDYLNLNVVSDIGLDTLTWSGGNTTLEAIACNLPVVTYPGEFMRGRHSYGILKMLGVTDTIATSETEYIDIAVRLGNDPQWRQNIVEKIKANHSNLYDDLECVRALEEFYQRVVLEK